MYQVIQFISDCKMRDTMKIISIDSKTLMILLFLMLQFIDYMYFTYLHTKLIRITSRTI